MHKNSYDHGDVLCDMHYGYRDLPNNLEVVREVRLRTDHATEMLLAATGGKHPGNKYLVVVGRSPDYCHLVAVWSYDARYFGMVELKMTPQEDK